MMALYDFLRAGHVKRWHIVNTTCQQSIAEHSYLVAMIAMHLHSGMDCLASDSEIHQTAILALFHDATEIKTGDVPTPSKKLLREEAGNIGQDLFKNLDNRLLPSIPFLKEPLPESALCVKMADVIEAAYWIRENGVGRHSEIVAAGCWRRLEDLVHEYSKGDKNWYPAVNDVLMALGMPYISREERISPP